MFQFWTTDAEKIKFEPTVRARSAQKSQSQKYQQLFDRWSCVDVMRRQNCAMRWLKIVAYVSLLPIPVENKQAIVLFFANLTKKETLSHTCKNTQAQAQAQAKHTARAQSNRAMWIWTLAIWLKSIGFWYLWLLVYFSFDTIGLYVASRSNISTFPTKYLFEFIIMYWR